MEKQAVCAQGTTKATEGMGVRAARTRGLKEPIQAEEPPIPTASRDPGVRGGSALQGTSEPRSGPMGMISPRPSDPTESRDPSAEASLSTDTARGCGKLWGRSARPGPVSREPRSEHGREFRRGSLRGRFLGRPRSLGPPSSQKMTPTLHSRAISSALLLQPREANTLHLCGVTPSPSSWTRSVPRDGVMAKECRAPVTAGSLLGDAVFGGLYPWTCWWGRCAGPCAAREGQRESLFHPHRSEPRGHFLTSGSASSPNGTTATPASLGGASRTSLCQHWEGNTFLLAVTHSVHRPPHALRQLCQTRGCRGAAGRGPLQEQMLNHKKGNTLPASLTALCA